MIIIGFRPNGGLVAYLLSLLVGAVHGNAFAVNVGDSYGGGTVFCVSQTADVSQCVTSGSGCYGLVVANNDQSNFFSNSLHGMTWAGDRGFITGADSSSNGATNTATIIASRTDDNSSNNAAWLCHDYIDPSEGHHDWYLPSKNELNKLYLFASANNLIGTNCIGGKVGGIQCFIGTGSPNYRYWSSTDEDYAWAWFMKFSDGVQDYYGLYKEGAHLGVRAVRSFGVVSPVVSPVAKTGYKNTNVVFTNIEFASKFSGACLNNIKAVTLPAHGKLLLSGGEVGAGQVIAVTDLNNLTYQPNTDYTGSDSFLWNASSDGVSYAATSASVNINIQTQPPTIVSNNIMISEGETLTITTAMLNATSNNGGAISYTVTNLLHCYFQLTSSIGNHITSFTQAQIAAGLVQMVHDGSSSAPAFNFTVSDGESFLGNQNAIIQFTGINEGPYVATEIPKQQGRVAEEFRYTVPTNTFVDPDGDTLSLSAFLSTGASLPGWLNFDKASASFSGTPITEGITGIKLVAKDPSQLTATAEFDIEVLGASDGNTGNNWCERNPATCGGIIAAVTGGAGVAAAIPATIIAIKKLRDVRSNGNGGGIELTNKP